MKRLTLENFIERSKQIHKNMYDYSLVEYIKGTSKVKIKCKKCKKIFEQSPTKHLQGRGCNLCNKMKKLTLENFIEKSNTAHKNKYDYSSVCYKNNREKIKITCPKHGIFEQTPHNHIDQKQGCPKCKGSKGEGIIRKVLVDNNIKFTTQKSFKNCKNIKTLFFDFYLPNQNTCIEYDGIQHYFVKEQWGGEEELKNIQLRDKIKNEYCKDNNIHLIRISFEKIKDIEKILKKKLKTE